ncbi:G-protein coupled receptor dmsr-1-like [Dreissena polymorpha]|nr:G-protein coupled receptor dmsr-1-like [Dreissena polymorpha]
MMSQMESLKNSTNITLLYTSTPKYIDVATYTRLQELKSSYANIHGYLSTAVCLVGILANIANIVVLNKKHMRTSTNIILLWLAVADLCAMVEYVTFAIPFYVFKEEGMPSIFHNRTYGWMFYLLFHANFSLSMHSISIWLTIMLATFRFIYIFLFTRANKYCSIRHAKIVILIIYIGAVVLCIPNYISNYWVRVNITNTVSGENETVYTFEERNYGPYLYIFDMNYWIQSILIKLVPCVLLTILTIMLILGLRKAYKNHQQIQSQGLRNNDVEKHHEHYRTTSMLLAVVILFLIVELPHGIMTLLMIFMGELHSELYDPLGDILDIVALMNSGVNFVLYCSMSKQFRDTFIATFCKCFTSNEDREKWINMSLITQRNRASSRKMSNITHANGSLGQMV